MRTLLFAGAALIASPAAAQDHSAHEEHRDPVQETDHSAHEAMEHSQHRVEQQDEATPDHPQHGAMNHSSMDHGEMDIPAGPPPPRAFEGPEHAAEMYFDADRLAAARAYNRIAHGRMTTGRLLAERLEARLSDGHDAYLWDVSAWYGTATDKIVFKTEGEGNLDGGAIDDAEMQLLWGHAIGPFVDLQAGMRVDIEPESAAHLAVGVAGLAPYMIHFDAAAFVSDEGDLTARIEAEHDMKFTQRLILQPRMEAELSAQDIPERGIGSGLSKIEVGARLRYEIARELAPYIGVEYEAATGGTADYIRAAGDDPDGVAVLLGLRFWF
ncbi:copper resistance protein B [Aurantiacibacter zhengii]|uniref:Copper resistance protein B n=1 Tax=Aurantiacibacter zhengii TaxID=2307003 RepID=A0A418NTP4_9SPHN|nr:copper resistance protein B [Aurantiacibacter zhengii]RIV86768.1 copper resistance protein B [Aurantiacibacter zhengii]